jgi:hypothetical protein
VRSTFNAPCVPEVGAAEFYSGYFVGDDAGSQIYEILVNSTGPIVRLSTSSTITILSSSRFGEDGKEFGEG